MTKNLCVLIICFGFIIHPQLSNSQNRKLNYEEDSLQYYGKLLLNGHTNEIRFEANACFLTLLKKSLKLYNSFEYPYDSLTMIARIIPDDKSFRIFNWQLPVDDGTCRFYAIMQSYNYKTKSYALYELIDGTEKIKIPQEEKLPYNKWYGAHYYKILTHKSRGKKYYTILGWKGNSGLTQKKVIDAFTISQSGEPFFGCAIFKAGKKTAKRIVFEYSTEVSMSLKYDEKNRVIVYDHLSPKEPELKGQYQFYGPDFSHDALEFKNGKWIKIEDFDARNSERKYTKNEARQDKALAVEKYKSGKISREEFLKEIDNIEKRLNPAKTEKTKDLFPKKTE